MIQNALVMTDSHKPLSHLDILIEGDHIAAIGNDLNPAEHHVDEIVAGKDRLVLPGLVNAHLHSHDRFDKGRFGTLPLEVWILLYNPPIFSRDWSSRECYLRTVLSGMELLRSGTTLVIDDVHHGLPIKQENINAVFEAYEDLGIRAQVSVAHSDKPFYMTVPYFDEILPVNLKERQDIYQAPTTDWVLSYWRELTHKWRDRVQFVLSASGPQRCTDEFLQATWAMSEEYDLPVVIHVLETRIQKMSGPYFYNRSVVEHMDDLGLLTSRSNLVHGVWMTDSDLERVADHGACIIHCPGSNLKLGSGIAPVADMINAGIPVGLGTDNHNANDNANLFETIKLTALLSAEKEGDFSQWLQAEHILSAATQGGARCALLQDEVGTLEVGKKADFIVMNLDSNAFTPCNDIANQLVFCEQGSSIERVVVDGKTVFIDGNITTVNEAELMAEVRDMIPGIQAKIRKSDMVGRKLEPYYRQVYEKCLNEYHRYH